MILPKVGINLTSYNYYGTTLPFIDYAKMGNSWFSVWTSWKPEKDNRVIELGPNGYPAKLESDQIAQTFVFLHNGEIYPTGKYILQWQGDGNVRIKSQTQPITTELSRTVNSAEYNIPKTNPNGIYIEIIATNPRNPVRNIVLRHESSMQHQQEMFNLDWLKSLKPYGVLRFMDWLGTNGSELVDYKDVRLLYDAHWGGNGGIPHLSIVALCNKLNVDAWICVPHKATDDFVETMALTFNTYLYPHLRVWVEYSNEVWNGMFTQAKYAQTVLNQKYNLTNYVESYGRRSKEIFDIFSKVYRKSRLIRVLAGQAANYGTLNAAARGCGTENFDVMAIAPYFSCDPLNAFQTMPLEDAKNWAFVAMEEHINNLMSNTGAVGQCKTIADSNKVPLITYEAGQHLVAKPAQHNDAAYIQFLTDLNRDQRMGEAYSNYLNKWYAINNQTMLLFSDIYRSNKWGSWGLQETYLDVNAPKYVAVQNYFK